MKKEKDCRSHKKGLEKRGKWKRLFLPPPFSFHSEGWRQKILEEKGEGGKDTFSLFFQTEQKNGKEQDGKI